MDLADSFPQKERIVIRLVGRCNNNVLWLELEWKVEGPVLSNNLKKAPTKWRPPSFVFYGWLRGKFLVVEVQCDKIFL